jgi:hypothetical protein
MHGPVSTGESPRVVLPDELLAPFGVWGVLATKQSVKFIRDFATPQIASGHFYGASNPHLQINAQAQTSEALHLSGEFGEIQT